jgi:molecular chaperone IbpA
VLIEAAIFKTRLTKEKAMTSMTYIKDVFGKDLFGQFQPFTVGFDHTLDTLKQIAEQSAKVAGYPPYNIRQVKDNKYVIEMAVAGFGKSDIEMTLDGNKLVIKGATKDDTETDYLYKGIANRSFERTFTLADKVEIKDAELVNGMLKVWLENMIKAQDAIKKITIKEKNE